ncbi:MAG: hypothetical protein ACOYN0_19680 [Phycisphaerales bacterium]
MPAVSRLLTTLLLTPGFDVVRALARRVPSLIIPQKELFLAISPPS